MIQTTKTTIATAFAGLLLASALAFAHHGGSMYPRDREVVLEDAVVVDFLFVNPHARLIFSWVDEEGSEAEWEGELSGSNELIRSRIYPDLVAPGDRITVKGYPHDSVPRNLRLISIVFPDGREVPLP